jgi:hypothetical protein
MDFYIILFAFLIMSNEIVVTLTNHRPSPALLLRHQASQNMWLALITTALQRVHLRITHVFVLTVVMIQTNHLTP